MSMDYAAAADALMRRKILEDIYDRMSDEEKRIFVIQSMQGKSSTDDILKALQQQSAQLTDLRHHQQTFSEDFLSNIIGNATWDGAVWLVRRLARLI